MVRFLLTKLLFFYSFVWVISNFATMKIYILVFRFYIFIFRDSFCFFETPFCDRKVFRIIAIDINL